jgi:hypothetical protein
MDITTLKMRDLAEVEELTGYPMDLWESSPKVKLTMAIAYVLGKRSNPELTWDKVQDMDLEEIQTLTGEIEAPKAKKS